MKYTFNPFSSKFDITASSLSDLTTKDHDLLSGLTDDDHTQYALLAGRSGGQTFIGGTGSGDDLTLRSTSNATKGTIFFGTDGLNVYDEVNSRWGIGIAAPTDPLTLVSSPTDTTSGSTRGYFGTLTPVPASNSARSFFANDNFLTVADNQTVNYTGSLVGGRYLVQVLGDGVYTTTTGLLLQAFLGPIFGSPNSTGTATTMTGTQIQVNNKSGATGTTITDQVGGYFFSGSFSPGNVTRLVGGHMAAGASSSGSGVGTISQWIAGRFSRRNPSGTNSLTAGTLTNAYMGYIDGWPSGPTYTNTPIQLYLEDNDVTAIGLYQADLAANNYILGPTMHGIAANASALLHIQHQTITSEVFRIESVATNDDVAERHFQARVATTDATVTTLATITIPATTTVHIRAEVVARRTGGTAGTAEDGAAYEIQAAVKNVAGTATIIGAVGAVFTAEDQAAWNATIDVSGATARIRVTGAANNSVSWHTTFKTYLVSS